MGHGLHGLRLQGQEPASLPLVPVLLPVPCDLPHLLECVKLLDGGKQKDVLSNLLTNTQGLCSSHLRSFSLQAVELPPQFRFVSSHSCLKISSSNKNMQGSSASLVSTDMQIKTDFTTMARTKKLGVGVGEACTLLVGV